MTDKGKSLSESDSKRLLSDYGLPLPIERQASTVDDAVSAAEEIGFPVALKADAPDLMHKTEAGLVVLNLTDEAGVRQAARRLLQEAPAGSGLLIQEMVKGQRELMLGMKRDRQYGPCVSFGIGGIFAEALNDVALRLAPLTEPDALDMIDQIRAAKILGSYRGMTPADRDALAQTLIGLGKCALDHPEIAEIDVNPMIITDDGRPVAVDALVVYGGNGSDA